jgi:hypothetical protein
VAAPPPLAPVVVVDVDAGWRRAVLTSRRVELVAPGDVERVGEIGPARVVVNLAAEGALAALWVLHASDPGRAASACLSVPGSDRALPLGRVDALPPPCAAEAIVATIVRAARRRARVVAAGRDAPAMLALRRLLAHEGFGVSIAWDAEQARDLCPMVRPHVLCVDLDLPRGGGHGVVAEHGAPAPAPALVLVPGADDARAFATAYRLRAAREPPPRRHEALGMLLGDGASPERRRGLPDAREAG